MKRSFPVIDADGHVLERDRELREFLPAEFRAVPGKREYPLFAWDGWARGALSPHRREHPSVDLWTRFLDATEIALTVLYPNEGLNIGLQRDRDWAVALARAYNDWLHHDFLSVSPRFHGVALLATQEPLEAAKELERAVRDLGMVAGMLPGVMSPMRGLGLPEFDPIYQMAERLDVPLAVHSGPAVELGLDHVQSFAGVYPLSHPFAQMQQLTSMMIYGVFERFTKLRVAFLESGCGWVPYLADRLDESWEHRRKRWPYPSRQSPSETMRGGNLYYACEREEKTLMFLFGRQIEDWAKAEIEKLRGRRKSINLPGGTVGFRHEEIALAQARVGADRIQPPADDTGRIEARLGEHRGDEGSRRRLAVRSCDRDAALEAHELGQHHRPRHDGNVRFARAHDFGIVRLHGRGHDDGVGGGDVLRGVPDRDADPHRAKPPHRRALRKVRSRDGVAEIAEDLRDSRHARAADADEVDALHLMPHGPAPRRGRRNASWHRACRARAPSTPWRRVPRA